MGAMRRNVSWEQLRTSEWKQNNYTGYIGILRFVPGQRDTLVSTTCIRVDWQSGTLDSGWRGKCVHNANDIYDSPGG